MKKINLRTFSTPLIIGTGLFSATTGLLMFFVSEAPFKYAHEIIGIGFCVAILLHIYTNWRPFKRYFLQQGVLVIAVALLVGIGMVARTAFFDKGEPEEFIMETLEQTSLDRLAPIVGMEPHQLIQQLATDGFTVENPRTPVTQIAEQLGVDTDDILLSVFR
jgi:hypothetical protein